MQFGVQFTKLKQIEKNILCELMTCINDMYLFLFQYLTERVSMYVHAYTLYSSVRPFGSSLLVGSWEDDRPQLYVIDPSGVSHVSNCFTELLAMCQKLQDNLTFGSANFAIPHITSC